MQADKHRPVVAYKLGGEVDVVQGRRSPTYGCMHQKWNGYSIAYTTVKVFCLWCIFVCMEIVQ